VIQKVGKDDEIDERWGKVYDFVVRRFLGGCSRNAKGFSTEVKISIGGEVFGASGRFSWVQSSWVSCLIDKLNFRAGNP
jgi:DNA topoisomerase IA